MTEGLRKATGDLPDQRWLRAFLPGSEVRGSIRFGFMTDIFSYPALESRWRCVTLVEGPNPTKARRSVSQEIGGVLLVSGRLFRLSATAAGFHESAK